MALSIVGVLLPLSALGNRVEMLRAAKQPGKVIVSPSVAKADFMHLGADLTAAVDGGAE